MMKFNNFAAAATEPLRVIRTFAVGAMRKSKRRLSATASGAKKMRLRGQTRGARQKICASFWQEGN